MKPAAGMDQRLMGNGALVLLAGLALAACNKPSVKIDGPPTAGPTTTLLSSGPWHCQAEGMPAENKLTLTLKADGNVELRQNASMGQGVERQDIDASIIGKWAINGAEVRIVPSDATIHSYKLNGIDADLAAQGGGDGVKARMMQGFQGDRGLMKIDTISEQAVVFSHPTNPSKLNCTK